MKLKKYDIQMEEKSAKSFMAENGSSKFNLGEDLKINVDMVNQIIHINDITLSPAEFSYEAREKILVGTGSTSGVQNVHGSGGVVGTVFVPGETFTTKDCMGYEIIICKNKNKIIVINFHIKELDRFYRTKIVMNQIGKWCESITGVSASYSLSVIDDYEQSEYTLIKISGYPPVWKFVVGFIILCIPIVNAFFLLFVLPFMLLLKMAKRYRYNVQRKDDYRRAKMNF